MSDIKLYNDDAIKILKSIPSESIDMCFSDIPYLVTSRGNSGTMGGGTGNLKLQRVERYLKIIQLNRKIL